MTRDADGTPSRRHYDRRTVLASILAGGTVGLAGCGGSGDDGAEPDPGTTDATGTASGTATRTPDGTVTPDATTIPEGTPTPDGTPTPSDRVVAECSVSATEVAVGEAVDLDASDAQGSRATFDVDGDGTADVSDSDDLSISVEFDEPGTVTPRVTVEGESGTDSATCGEISVTEPGPPEIACEVTPTETAVGDPVIIDATDTEGASQLLIDPTGDGEYLPTATNVTFVHNYEAPGEYTPRVDVPDDRVDPVECATVTVSEAEQPTARCSLSTTEATVGDEVGIDASESDALQVFFDVDGDGEFELVDGEDLAATFTVTTPGETTPRIRAENAAGEDVAECETITVTEDAEAIAVVDLPVTATYLRTNNDGAGDTEPIALSEYGVSPGDRITLTRVGEFYRGSPFGTAGRGMIGVFSASGSLASSDRLHRVADAIDAGPSIRTSDTYYGGVPTNVLEDFAVATNDGSQRSATVEVPEGATHLFVAAKDDLYDDNEPVTDRYAVRIADGSGRNLTADVDPEESVAFGDRAEGVPDPDVEVDLNPAATYLHTNGDDAPDARPIDLENLGVTPGDELTLIRLGSFSNGGGYGLLAVFSATEFLLPSDRRHRVPGAVDAGLDHQTSATFRGSEPTDVPEDFLVADHDRTVRAVSVTVPPDARYLFAAAKDNLYEDNGDDGFGIGVVTP